MPIYEYRCGDCGGAFELLVRSTDKAALCPDCGSARVSKLFSTFAHRSAGSAGTEGGGTGPRSSCGGCSAKSCSSCR